MDRAYHVLGACLFIWMALTQDFPLGCQNIRINDSTRRRRQRSGRASSKSSRLSLEKRIPCAKGTGLYAAVLSGIRQALHHSGIPSQRCDLKN